MHTPTKFLFLGGGFVGLAICVARALFFLSIIRLNQRESENGTERGVRFSHSAVTSCVNADHDYLFNRLWAQNTNFRQGLTNEQKTMNMKLLTYIHKQ